MVLLRAIFVRALCTVTYISVVFKMSSAKSAASSHGVVTHNNIDLEKACFNFTVGNPEKKEFYSPNYPNPYPSNIKCTKRITAEPGHVVELDFRDQFKLEESKTCDYDVLIVRDGPYGYSPEKGRFCGQEFPVRITSSNKYLWLQFISDESIEHTGFRAVYNFIPVAGVPRRPHDKECVFEKTGPSGQLLISEIDNSIYQYAEVNNIPIDCVWIITADSPKKKIYLNFKTFGLKFPNDCEKNLAQVYARSRIDSQPIETFCGTVAEPLTVDNQRAEVRLFLYREAYNHTKFEVHFTVQREVKKPETCDATEFSCEDGTCIDKSLICDEVNDCKYQYDEDEKLCAKEATISIVLTSHHMLIILIVFFALVVAMCVSVSISCYNKVQERKAREREYKERRSKEASLEATVDRTIRGHSSPDRGGEPSLSSQLSKPLRSQRTPYPDDGDDESSDGCYVPDMDISPYQKYPNGGTLPRRPEGRSVSRGGIQSDLGRQPYPFISQSIDSIESESLATTPAPPVPTHHKDRREQQVSPTKQQQLQQAPTPAYRFVGGKAVPEETSFTEMRQKPTPKQPEQQPERPATSTLPRSRWPPEKTPTNVYPSSATLQKAPPPESTRGPQEPRGTLTRGPLEAGVPRSVFTRTPGDYGLPRFGAARPNPETAPRSSFLSGGTDKVLPLSIYKAPDSYGNAPYRPNPYKGYKTKPDERMTPSQFRAQAKTETTSDRDSSRADSADSIQSAPDVVAQR